MISIFLPAQSDAGIALDSLVEEGEDETLGDLGPEPSIESDGGSKRMVSFKDRQLVLFNNYRTVPRISITLSGQSTEDLAGIYEDTEIVEAPGSDEEIGTDDIGSLTNGTVKGHVHPEDSETMEVARAIVNSDGLRDVVLPNGIENEEEQKKRSSIDGLTGIPKGAMVLIEGEVGPSTREVSQMLCQGILENGYTVTYVTTQLNLGDFITEMYERNNKVAEYLPDHRLLCIPVVPLIEKKQMREDYTG